MREYSIIYKQTGIRTLSQYLTPRIHAFESFQFPRNSLLHYVTLDESGIGPDEDLFYLQDIKRKILVENVNNYSGDTKELLGSPMFLAAGLANKERSFFFEHKKFRLVKNIGQINNTNGLSLVNYSYLPSVYRYHDQPLVDYYKWYNLFNTVISKMIFLAKTSIAEQFLFLKIPAVIPSLSTFRKFKSITHLSLETFNTPELLIVRDIYHWIINDPENSLFSKVPNENLEKLNLVVYFNNKYYLLNMYYFYSFIKDHETTLKLTFKTKPEMLAKMFLNSLVVLQSDGIIEENPEAEETQDKNEEVINEEETDTDDTETESTVKVEGNRVNAASSKPIKYLTDIELDKDENQEEAELQSSIANLKSNLDNLEREDKLRELSTNTSFDELVKSIHEEDTPHEALNKKLDNINEVKILTGSEIKALRKKIDSFPSLSNPYDPNSKLISSTKITKEELEIDPYKDQMKGNDAVIDKTMLKSTLVDFDKQYIENTLHKDILNAVMNLQHAGIIIDSYKIEPTYTIGGDYETHIVKIHPLDGKPSTLYFKLPIINSNGEFMVNQIRSRTRKQRGDAPIKKIKPDKVALTSYYNKLFVERSQRKADSLHEYLFKYIFSNGIQIPDNFINTVKINDVFDHDYKSSRLYSAMSMNFSTLVVNDYTFNFNHKEMEKELDKKELDFLDMHLLNPVGKYKDGILALNDKDELVIVKGKDIEVISNFFELLGIDPDKLPIEYTNVKIFSHDVPLALVLGHYVGLDNILKLLNVSHEFVDTKTKVSNDSLVIEFKDKKLIIDKTNKEAIGIFGGLIKQDTKKYHYEEFNKKNVYFNLLADMGLNTIYTKEMDLLKELFIDPITLELLKDNKDPTTFIGLLLKANKLLVTDDHPDDLDMRYMRIKGYERVAGIVYNTLTKAIRVYKLKNNNGQGKVDLSPNQIFKEIVEDPANLLVTDINPIQILKQSEAVTFLGHGGRQRDVMNKESRRYHPNDMGIISEATVDSGDVAINTYLSANPLLNSTRGTVDKYSFDRDKGTSLFSTSALLAPASIHDDAKRVNMVNVQQSHTVAAEGYRQPYVRTGYEYIIPQRMKNEFAYSADEDGTVDSINKLGLIVKYKSGKLLGLKLGRSFGRSEGSYYPHEIITLLKVGDSFKKDDILAFNSGFFEEDILNPGQVIFKNNILTTTALYETPQTWEDSSAISKRTSEKMKTKTTKVKSIVVQFDQDLRKSVKIGDFIQPMDTLVYIEDPITAKANLFTDSSISLLKKLNTNSPKSKVEGTVEKIEVYYNGEKEDMSKGLLELTNESDKNLAKECRSTNRPVVTGRVTNEHRVEGVPLELDHAEIRYYVTIENTAGVGDKGVFANQLKSVIGEVMEYDMTTEDGTPIDAVFGQKSIDARIVLSPAIMGTTATLLKLVAKKAVEIYKG